ncbi:PucR family transcriptional regulator [Allokutzneria sp. A3M-2-11 16]|uniref:PucR family transcriptional regulator n=1 Tax=Allokutzneria sp. A3M-2-11 16 TaxID=2962043 RepID=UPI0020B6C59C|nr:PucR family transcriptional regulator [Allokutzneria sp. A3M-2-11 16]MCP3801466.1 PucR family transcriptional regulator [Allokutzneria sp. A3M-2-11 16]
MYPTVEDVLALPELRRGRPVVVAGAAGLDHRVRWVHVAEVADIAGLLHGGELVLTTGIALPADDAGLTRYIGELAGVGVAGLVVELVRRWPAELPPALVAAAQRHGLPLVALNEETRFVSVTEAVVSVITSAQVRELRATEQVHEIFTALTLSGAGPAEILREVARLSGLPVVLESLDHHLLAYDVAGGDPAELLAVWENGPIPQTGYDAAAGWLITMVGARGDNWGRLLLRTASLSEQPSHQHTVVAERAASALALNRLLAKDDESLERQSHRALLIDLLAPGTPVADAATRATALGVRLGDRRLVGISVRPRTTISATPAPALATQEVLRELSEVTASAARRAGIPALVGVVDDTSVRALLTLPTVGEIDPTLHRFASDLHRTVASTPWALPVVVALGTTVIAVPEAARSLAEAAHVAEAALRSGGARVFHRLADVRLRGLMHLMHADQRVRAFVERELSALLAHDRFHNTRLVDTLRDYCQHGGNKSAAAGAAHLSRTAFYQQLARIEQILGISLDDAESMLSLHVALLAHDASI